MFIGCIFLWRNLLRTNLTLLLEFDFFFAVFKRETKIMRLQTTRYHPMDDPDLQSVPQRTRDESRRGREAIVGSTSKKKGINSTKLQDMVAKIGDPKPGSSLTIKVAGGAHKTTPPKQIKSTKKNMRRRRTDYYNEASLNAATGSGYNNDVLYGARTASSGFVNREKRTSSSSQHKKRLEMDGSHNLKKPEKFVGRNKEKYTRPGETDEIPLGQWVVIICLILGLVGHHIRKNYGTKKKATLQHKADKHGANLHAASLGHKRRKKIHGKHGSKKKTLKSAFSNAKKTVLSKLKDTSLQDHPESSSHVQATDAPYLQNTDQPPATVSHSDTDHDPQNQIITSTGSAKKKKKKKTKSSQTATKTEPKQEKHSRSTPDSISTDGSSSTAAEGAIDTHPKVDHFVLLPDAEDNHTLEDEEHEREGWTTVGTTTTKQRNAKPESDAKPDQHNLTSQSAAELAPHPDPINTAKEERTSPANQTNDIKHKEKLSTEADSPVENKNAISSEEQLTASTSTHEVVAPAEESAPNSGEETVKPGHSESHTETDNDFLPTEEEDAAFARMLQKQEEEMAAQAITSGLELISDQLSTQDTWEEVNHRKRKSRKAFSGADDSQD